MDIVAVLLAFVVLFGATAAGYTAGWMRRGQLDREWVAEYLTHLETEALDTSERHIVQRFRVVLEEVL